MHTLPLFCPTPCMPSPYSVSPHACSPPILSHLCMPSPLFYPTPYSIPPHAYLPPYSIPPHAYPAPYSIPAHAYIPLILSHPMHTLPLFYPSLYTPSPYSIPPHTCPPLIPSHCIHVLSCSLPAHTGHPSILFQLMHALLTPCAWTWKACFSFDIWECRFWICSYWEYHHHLPSFIIWSINLSNYDTWMFVVFIHQNSPH